MALAPALVDKASQRAEDLGNPVNLIENHEVALKLTEKEDRVGQFVPIFSGLQIKIESASPGIGYAPRQGRLPRLARPNDGHGSLSAQRLLNFGGCPTRDHPCILDILC